MLLPRRQLNSLGANELHHALGPWGAGVLQNNFAQTPPLGRVKIADRREK